MQTPTMENRILTGQTALITGANRGIGKALAKTIAHAGANTIVTARNPEDLRHIEDIIAAAGGTSDAFQMDVTDAAQVRDVVNAVIQKYGQLDLLINNAGIDTARVCPGSKIQTSGGRFRKLTFVVPTYVHMRH